MHMQPSKKPRRLKSVMLPSLGLLSLGLSFSGCAAPKLGVTEICFINGIEHIAECHYMDGSKHTKMIPELDKYTAFSIENSDKILKYTQKCLKAGVKP